MAANLHAGMKKTLTNSFELGGIFLYIYEISMAKPSCNTITEN